MSVVLLEHPLPIPQPAPPALVDYSSQVGVPRLGEDTRTNTDTHGHEAWMGGRWRGSQEVGYHCTHTSGFGTHGDQARAGLFGISHYSHMTQGVSSCVDQLQESTTHRSRHVYSRGAS